MKIKKTLLVLLFSLFSASAFLLAIRIIIPGIVAVLFMGDFVAFNFTLIFFFYSYYFYSFAKAIYKENIFTKNIGGFLFSAFEINKIFINSILIIILSIVLLAGYSSLQEFDRLIIFYSTSSVIVSIIYIISNLENKGLFPVKRYYVSTIATVLIMITTLTLLILFNREEKKIPDLKYNTGSNDSIIHKKVIRKDSNTNIDELRRKSRFTIKEKMELNKSKKSER